jgi:hypothetical protein
MRERSPVKSPCLVAVVLFLASGCTADEQAVSAEREPATRSTAPSPALGPALDPPRQGRLTISAGSASSFVNDPRVRDGDDIGDVKTPIMTRLVYQCSDDVTFAVRTAGDRIEVYPPGFTLGYIVLYRQPADSGVRYTREHAEFRADDELATLILGGNERYVDCVSNPAAAVWATVPRTPAGR